MRTEDRVERTENARTPTSPTEHAPPIAVHTRNSQVNKDSFLFTNSSTLETFDNNHSRRLRVDGRRKRIK